MKRTLIALSNLLLVLIMLSACGASKATTAVINQINEIGKVTVDSGDKIEAAEDAYTALKDGEKAQVTNYAVLTDARGKYDDLREEYDAYQLFVKSAEDIISGQYDSYYSGIKKASDYFVLSSDEKSVKIDTKTSKYDSTGESYALQLLLQFHELLGLPDSLINKMSTTRALDGTQTQTAGKITVTWNYHPDNGMNVVYEYDYNK